MVAGGEYYYFGLKYWLPILLTKSENKLPKAHVEELILHVNIDGIPLFNSSTTSLWPILGCIRELNDKVFPIAVFCSKKKPSSIDDYLKDFLFELKLLESTGFLDATTSRLYKIKLGAVICDAPARAMVKGIKTHNGYDSCERCVHGGKWCRKVILSDLTAPLRTDDTFKQNCDAAHHVNISPLSELKFGMVTGFPLDYMHLICLGDVRLLINLWLNGPPSCKLSQTIISTISEKLVSTQPYISREFSRKPRALSEFKQWKATELRLFLLYTGPAILINFLSPRLYKNFLTLSVAMRILLSPSLLQYYVDYASQLLKNFVENFAAIYGEEHIVYNVHSTIHIADDAKLYGVLDNCSSFKYESYLGKLKKCVRSSRAPCAQIVKRILEEEQGQGCSDLSKADLKCTFFKPHVNGPVFLSFNNCSQFKQCKTSKFFISISVGDNCVAVKGTIGLIRNILNNQSLSSECGYVMFEKFSRVETFFTEPLPSDRLSIYYADKLNGVCEIILINDLSYKCVAIPYKTGFVVIPQNSLLKWEQVVALCCVRHAPFHAALFLSIHYLQSVRVMLIEIYTVYDIANQFRQLFTIIS
jgi:hypothetical protein